MGVTHVPIVNMELSSEDSLRLNVLVANAQAIRIDEQDLCVYGLRQGGEAQVRLNPNCRPDAYIRQVREMLSSHVLGSPRGYPVYLRRWTRMGQMQNTRLDQLLMLGEPEAVVAVSCAPGLTDELARRVWWAMPTAEIARHMLQRTCVVKGRMGRVLAEYLVDYLPFEEDAKTLVETTRLVLQDGLIDEEMRRRVWSRSARKNAYCVGFLQMTPDDLPQRCPPREDWEELCRCIAPLIAAQNPFAIQLSRLLSGAGQAYLAVSETVLRKPVDQDVFVAALEAIRAYSSTVRLPALEALDIGTVIALAEEACALNEPQSEVQPRGLRELLATAPRLRPEIRAMLVLSQVGEPLVRPIFARTTAVGSLMRKKLEPITAPILEQYAVLRRIA
jgi:hypothetical protein